MNIVGMSITSKRVWWTGIAALSLCLVLLGMKVPDVSRLHSPKPRPRAVIEKTPVKICNQDAIKAGLYLEACQTFVVLPVRMLFRSSFRQGIHSVQLIPIKHHTARAPPVISA